MKKYDEIEIKQDCFAYKEAADKRKTGTCLALTDLYCKKEICNFYKSKEQIKD